MAYQPTVHYIYFGRSRLNRDAIKVGHSMNPRRRLKALNADLILTIALDETEARYGESRLHSALEYARIDGEWFNRDDVNKVYVFWKEMGDDEMGGFKSKIVFHENLYGLRDPTDHEFVEHFNELPLDQRITAMSPVFGESPAYMLAVKDGVPEMPKRFSRSVPRDVA